MRWTHDVEKLGFASISSEVPHPGEKPHLLGGWPFNIWSSVVHWQETSQDERHVDEDIS